MLLSPGLFIWTSTIPLWARIVSFICILWLSLANIILCTHWVREEDYCYYSTHVTHKVRCLSSSYQYIYRERNARTIPLFLRAVLCCLRIVLFIPWQWNKQFRRLVGGYTSTRYLPGWTSLDSPAAGLVAKLHLLFFFFFVFYFPFLWKLFRLFPRLLQFPTAVQYCLVFSSKWSLLV